MYKVKSKLRDVLNDNYLNCFNENEIRKGRDKNGDRIVE
jgi:hypothetical protein